MKLNAMAYTSLKPSENTAARKEAKPKEHMRMDNTNAGPDAKLKNHKDQGDASVENCACFGRLWQGSWRTGTWRPLNAVNGVRVAGT
jgi:hypothetical protein